MLRRIKALLNAPFARPPGRRGVFQRFLPECCAAFAYLVLGITLVACPDFELAIAAGPMGAFGLSGVLLVLLPTAEAALSFAGEKNRGTVEALLLTPLARREMVRGRFWHLVLRWLRLVAWLLPLCLLLPAGSLIWQVVEESRWLESAILLAGLAGSPRVTLPLLLKMGCPQTVPGFCCLSGSAVFGAAWLISDLSVLVFVVGLALHISVRARTAGRALLFSYLLAPGLLLVMLIFDSSVLWFPIAGWFLWRGDMGLSTASRVVWIVLGCLAPAVMALRYVLGFSLARRAARNFDRCALGEGPGS